MTLLYNFEKQRIEKVNDEEVTNLVASGTYAPRRGVRMPVIAPDGEAGSVPSEKAQEAFLMGFKFQTAADSKARAEAGIEAARQKAFGESTSTALAAGALRGATMGLSDVALRALGGEDVAEGLQATRELQPIASTVGEVGGAIAGMAIPVGPVAGVAKLGEKVTKGVAATERVGALAAKGTAGEIAAEILAKGAGSAVEGAFYGAGELLTEAALGDPNLTAQNAAVVFGANVLGGGVIGGLVPGGITAAKKTAENVKRILIEDANVPAKLGKAYGDMLSFLRISSDEQKEAYKKIFAPTEEARLRRERIADFSENPERAEQTAFDAVTKLSGVGKGVGDAFVSSLEIPAKNMEEFNSLLKMTEALNVDEKAVLKGIGKDAAHAERVFSLIKDETLAAQAAENAVQELRDAAKMEASVLGFARENVQQSAAHIKYAKSGNKLEEIRPVLNAFGDSERLTGAIGEAVKNSEIYDGGTAKALTTVLDNLREGASQAKNLTDMHKAVHDARMMLDGLFESARGVPSTQAKNTIKLVRSVRDEMNALLHSEKAFPGIGERFLKADTAFAEYLTEAKTFTKAFEEKVATIGGATTRVERAKASKLILKPLSDAAIKKQSAFDRMAVAVKRMNEAVDVPNPDVSAAIDALSKRVNSIKEAQQAALIIDKAHTKFGREMIDRASALLQKPKVFADDAARVKYEKFAAASEAFDKAFGSRSQAATLTKSPGRALAEDKMAILDNFSKAAEELEKVGIPTGAADAIAKIRKDLDVAIDAREALRILDAKESKTGAVLKPVMLGGAIGGLASATGATDIPGASYLGMIGGTIMANPKAVMTYLMRLERGNMTAANAIEEASRKYLGAKVPASVSGALGAVWSGRKQGISELSRSLERDEQEQHLDDHDLIKTRLTPMESIDHLDDVVKNQNPLLDDIAPGVYAETVNARQRAVSFLKTKFPADSDALFAGKSLLSASQKIKLDRYTAAAMNPSELLHEMSEGDVRPETVEAVQAVYPEIYAQIQQKLTETLADPKLQRSLSYKKKRELSKVLGIPTTESLQNIDLLQASWQLVPDETPSRTAPKSLSAFQSPTDGLQNRMNS